MNDWIKVTRRSPCPICGKPDWCTIGKLYVNCMRVGGVKPCKNGGWLHPIDGAKITTAARLPELKQPQINASAFLDTWREFGTARALPKLAQQLGVDQSSLRSLDAVFVWDLSQVNRAWHGCAWAFPMSDSYGNPVGIRLRDESGHKWAVTGSKEGIFLPATEPQARAWICEGPTDTAAGLSLGLYTIGRPSCLGGVTALTGALRRNNCREAVILADNDGPGAQGALRLVEQLRIPSCILTVPAKDLRDYVLAGGNAFILNALTNSTRWFQPKHERTNE